MMAGRGLKIALGVSLAANLFVAGAAAGAFATRLDFGRRRPAGPNLWEASWRLRPDEREALRAVLSQRVRDVGPIIRDAHAARRAAAAAIAAPNYDPAAAAAALARARTDEAKVREAVDASLLAFVGRLSPGDRAGLADAVVRGRLGRPDGESRPPGPPGEGPPHGAPPKDAPPGP